MYLPNVVRVLFNVGMLSSVVLRLRQRERALGEEGLEVAKAVCSLFLVRLKT